ncbi:hypothetical protein [Pandoraea pnomenusa]|uniref:hypothetical protein n=1 Tax=Pandoraea pnomenusa TaxID=93220 RepID=UPI003341A1BD
MVGFSVSVSKDLAKISKSLSKLETKQLPFATAQALNAVAGNVNAAERKALPEVFDRPTPFTVNAVAVKRARKTNLEALVYIKDIAASYLAPYEFGGNHKLVGSGRTWLNPKDSALLNQYGNLSRTTLRRLSGRPDVFIGTVKTKAGQSIGGVWQRPASSKRGADLRKRGVAMRGANKTDHLKLLIRFGDAKPVRRRLEFGERAFEVVDETFEAEFERSMAAAIATARLD